LSASSTTPTAPIQPSRPAYEAFETRDDLQGYGDNALLLFAAQLRLGFDDVDSFATNALTDGSNDKKCDLVAVVAEGTKIVVAQGYMTAQDKQEAPANKASDLNTGVSWLISGALDGLPQALRGAAEEVRSALASDTVEELEIWYVHNLPESVNVRAELDQAAATGDAMIRREFPSASVDVTAVEIGRTVLEEDYARTQAPILVSDTFSFSIPGGFEISANNWSAYSTAIRAEDLRALWTTHSVQLMSPNIRDYLGMVKSAGNINFGIKETAKSQPENFAIFNNGITVLVNDFEADPAAGALTVKGIGIVNGGQTTGALGEIPAVDAASVGSAMVMARFVKCNDPAVLEDIVRYNNTQNKVEATDFRSKDAIQERLRLEFAKVPDADYRGGRRGGARDAIVRRRDLVPDSSVAQSLAAFHGDPNLAYNETRTIWDNDGVYANVFRETLTARHIVFTYGLLKAVDRAKQNIMKIPEASRTEAQKKHALFFSSRGSNYLLVAAIGSCLETIVGRPIADRYALRFAKNVSPVGAMDLWQPVVDVVVAFSAQLASATDQGLKAQDRVSKAIGDFGAMIEATRSANPAPFDALSKAVDPPVATPTA
jgi:hypothetical protein